MLSCLWDGDPLGNKALMVSKDSLHSYWCPSKGHKQRKIVKVIGEKKGRGKVAPEFDNLIIGRMCMRERMNE